MRRKRVLKQVKLPNGGIIYYAKNRITDVTYININFPCGARVEPIPGLAHLVEHMMFTGTESHTKQELNDIASRFGSENAATSWRAISFRGDVLNNDIKNYLVYAEECINHSLLTQKLLDDERKVVLQEIKTYEDKYDQKNDYENYYNIYKQKFLKGRILGDEKSVNSIKPQDVRAFAEKWFVANNMEATIVSPLPLRKVKKLIVENFYSKLKVVDGFEKLPINYLSIEDDSFYTVKNENIKKTYITLNVKLNHGFCEEDYSWFNKFGLVLSYLRDLSHGVNRKLRTEKNLVYGCWVFTLTVEKEGMLGFATECDKKNVNEILKTMSEYISNLVANGLDEGTITKIKEKSKFTLAAKEPKVSTYFNLLADLKLYNKIFNSKKNREERLATTVEELNGMVKEVFENAKVSATIYGDADKKDVMTKAEFNKLFKTKTVKK